MWIVAILLIIVGIVFLVLGKRTSRHRLGRRQSFFSLGTVFLIFGVVDIVGLIINALI
ncbi:hypothetical protein [Staphylococcus kloosii]|jgi:Ca2+/Na+ antiporter|uniref:Uncharacterized protein n=1 Tax=Staphylococcus kloosii TaxID=29384 RepID=A0A921KWH6_9STAP|nr:hypothetical protein [Staphylococcus kloosii]MBF7023089.1 hypothetical protein [Staphylococcus kloosii]MBF7025584.1 hypothetical protein [Staphylococcus kloosii]MBF7029867.1 hypothetical protein [Staphylococcus kloosii]MCD8879112.1 hypothetical protein [Staphylococcus kloosii]SUM50287.1 Uncharacterised protein [Staphylococcus kloosii]